MFTYWKYVNGISIERWLRIIRSFQLYGLCFICAISLLCTAHWITTKNTTNTKNKPKRAKMAGAHTGRNVTIITVVIICCIGVAQVLNCHNKPHIIFIVLWPVFFLPWIIQQATKSSQHTERFACTNALFDCCIDSSNCMILVLAASSCGSCASNFNIKHFDVFVVVVVVVVRVRWSFNYSHDLSISKQ